MVVEGEGGSPQTFQFLISDIHRELQNAGVLCKSRVPKLLVSELLPVRTMQSFSLLVLPLYSVQK